MNEKLYKILRTAQWLIPALITFYGVLDGVFGCGLLGPVETIASAFVALIGTILQHDSKVYFAGKQIIDKEE